MKQGDLIRKAYPFLKWSHTYARTGKSILGKQDEHETEEGWAGGCRCDYEDGPAVYQGQCIQEAFYSCDGEGFIEYEILSIAEMPGKYQDRIIYRVTMIEPDGRERKSHKAHMVTRDKFDKWANSYHSSYPHDYEIDDQ